MVGLCFALLLLRKEQDGIHMPRGFMDDLEGEIIYEEVHESGLGEDIFSADLYCEDALPQTFRAFLSPSENPRNLFS